jgi:hypothetical protein
VSWSVVDRAWRAARQNRYDPTSEMTAVLDTSEMAAVVDVDRGGPPHLPSAHGAGRKPKPLTTQLPPATDTARAFEAQPDSAGLRQLARKGDRKARIPAARQAR